MKSIRVTAFAFALITYGATAGAAENTSELIRQGAPKGITEAFYTCIDRADSNTIAAAACISQERERQDRRLNTTYEALLRRLSPSQKKNLIEAERAWLKLRDNTVDFEDMLYGNEIVDNLQVAENEVLRIGRRADEMDEYLAIANGE